jgi:HAD superfamily phosphatase (TIGR01668 family)
MNKLFAPDLKSKNIFEIDYPSLKNQGILVLFFDLEQTLTDQVWLEPSLKLQEFFKDLKNKGFDLYVITNQRKSAPLERFISYLDAKIIYFLFKPFPWFLQHFITFDLKISARQTALIGDQLFVDILLSRILGCYAVWVEPVGPMWGPYDWLLRPWEKEI